MCMHFNITIQWLAKCLQSCGYGKTNISYILKVWILWAWVPICFFIYTFGTNWKESITRKRQVQPPQGSNPNWGTQFEIGHIQCHGVFRGVQWIRSSNASQQLDWWLHWHCLFHCSSSDHNKFGIRVIKRTNAFDVWARRRDSLTWSPKMQFFFLFIYL